MLTPRRTFLKTTLATGALAATSRLTAASSAAADDRDYYDLRAYRLAPDGSRDLLDRYLEQTLVPTLHERGIGPVGVFDEKSTDPAAAHRPTIWVVIPHRTLASYAAVAAEFNADADVHKSAGPYFSDTTKEHPAYARIDSWLLHAFTGQPRLKLPAARASASRVLELRTYESPSESRALGKIEMFNSGEIPVMNEVGLSPVFYGQALAGANLPHLSYMTSGPDMATHLQHWKAFSSHPAWIKLKADPRYADVVSQITKRFLTPTAYSEI